MKVFDFHRLLAKRFPYAEYYKVDGETCIVFRVLDFRQEPDNGSAEVRSATALLPNLLPKAGRRGDLESASL